MKRNRVIATTISGVALLAGVCFLPLPFHVDCALEIQPQNASQVFAMIPGHLVRFDKKAGDPVQPGEVIAELDNIDLRIQLAKQQGEYEQAVEKLDVLSQVKFSDLQAEAMLQTQREVVESKRQIVEKTKQRVAMLTVTAPRAGTIFPAPPKAAQPGVDEKEQLPTWNGNPFAEKNQDAVFAQSDLLCLVGNPENMEAVLVVDQHDIDLIREGIEVDMMIDSARLTTISGRIAQISQMDMRETPAHLATAQGGTLDVEMDKSGRLRPISTSYQVRVPLEKVDVPLRAGYRGQAKIYAGWKSLGWRFYRFLARTFRFEM
ncbi:MAG: hypothetical protein U0892_19840 [Pirellulales bacterium]